MRDFPAGQGHVDVSGLYAWFADDEACQLLSSVLGGSLPDMVYVGQAGAASRRSGTERSATLRSRIGGNHLRGNIGSSTFRKTLTAVLLDPLSLVLDRPGKLSPGSTAVVSEWMRNHLRLSTFACPDRATLGALEDNVLRLLDPPLNLMGMSRTPQRERLKALRSALVRP